MPGYVQVRLAPEGIAALNDILGTLKPLYESGMIDAAEADVLAERWADEVLEKYLEVTEI